MIDRRTKAKTGQGIHEMDRQKRISNKKGHGLILLALIGATAWLCLFMYNRRGQEAAPGLFYDAEFKHVVTSILHVPEDTPEEQLLPLMEQTESLCLYGGIKSLEDLKYFPSLKLLSLNQGNQYKYQSYYSEPVEPLSLEDVSGIRYATELEHLDIFNQSLGDLVILEHLDKLESLDLNNCSFTNPEVIGTLTSLTDLKLWRNSLTYLGFLDHLVNLRTLDLLENSTTYTGYEVLGNLTRMEDLFLCNAGINNIKFVSNMPDLKEIGVLDSAVWDISHLSGHKKLEMITFIDNDIDDISALKDLKSLKYLTIQGGSVSDLSPLANTKELRSLSIDNNKVTDVSPLSGLPELSYLSMAGNPVDDISPLLRCKKLSGLVMDRCVTERLQDIMPLSQIPNVSIHSIDEKRDLETSFLLDESMAEDEEMEIWCDENLYSLRYYKLDGVSYGDIDMDGIEEAAIVLSYGTEGLPPQSDSRTYPWKQMVMVLKRDSTGEFHLMEEMDIRKPRGICGNRDDYNYTSVLLKNGYLLIQETSGNSRARDWCTVTRYYGFENGKTSLLQSNQYKRTEESNIVDPGSGDHVIMTNVSEGIREEFLLSYGEDAYRSAPWKKLPVVRDCPPDVVFYDGDGINVTVSPDGFNWNYMEEGERKREQDTRYEWKPSAKSPKAPIHPLSPMGADNRSINVLPMAKAEDGTEHPVEFYLDSQIAPDQLIVYEWLFKEKSDDGMGYYMQPWPESELSPDLSNDMPVTVSLKPGRLYEIVAVWDGKNLERNGYSGEAQYLLETGTRR